LNQGAASDEVTDAIAHIEMHRQETEKESGLAAACSEALRKLHLLLEQEQAAQQSLGPGVGHTANVDAVTTEIGRIKRLAGVAGQHANSKRVRPGRQGPAPRPGGPRNPPRNKGRRTGGRRGGR